MVERLCNLACSWGGEFRLIAKIWGNKYPATPKWRLSLLEKSAMSVFVGIRIVSISQLKGLALDKESGTCIAEFYVLVRLFVLISLLNLASPSLGWVVVIGYLLLEGFNYILCIIFVDRYTPDWDLRSLNRSLLLLVINYFELIIGFASLYLWTGSIHSNGGKVSTVGDALYFSIVTITTLGYGDFSPKDSVGKFLVSLEAVMGILFIVLVLSTFIAGIPAIRKEKSD